MKIDFKQPKYVIPLIILPFLVLGFFIFGGNRETDKKGKDDKKVEGLNTNMPGVDTSISKGEIKNKFSAYQQAFKNVTDQSAMSDIDKPGEGVQGIDYESSYTNADKELLESQRKMDSLNQVLLLGQNKIEEKITQYNRSGGFGKPGQLKGTKADGSLSGNHDYSDNQLDYLLRMQQLDDSNNQHETANINNEDPDSHDSQMRVFYDQMKYLDSLQKTNVEKGKATKDLIKSNSYKKEFDPKKDTSFKPLPVTSTTARGQSGFNTIRNIDYDSDNIAAMIDQDIKATLGSRVRIRLLTEMNVGDYLIKKGTYIYGVVTGFQKQRVNVSIGQVLYNNTSLPVNIDLFDNDGYLGLYVPGSNFREFSKEIGTQATQGLSQVATPDNSDVRMNMLSQVFNTTTTTLSSLVKKDKAFLKYNYIVYLKENKASSIN